jgi:hypothetical protein
MEQIGSVPFAIRFRSEMEEIHQEPALYNEEEQICNRDFSQINDAGTSTTSSPSNDSDSD